MLLLSVAVAVAVLPNRNLREKTKAPPGDHEDDRPRSRWLKTQRRVKLMTVSVEGVEGHNM